MTGMDKLKSKVQEHRENKKAPYKPVATLLEDAATIDGLADLLIVKGIVKAEGEPGSEEYLTPEDMIKKYVDRYGSAVNGLCMLLYEKNIITEEEHSAAISVYHDAIRHFGSRATSFGEVQNFRKNLLRKRLGLEKQ